MENAQPESTSKLTQLLLEWSGGDQAALDQLLPAVHAELQKLAHNFMRRENSGHTLQTTALVHEAYLRLIDQKNLKWQNRAHFFGIAANLMRQILIDHARSRGSAKRGDGAARISLDDAPEISMEKASELVALDEALQELAEIDPRRARVVELRYFGGLSNEEISEVLGISINTIMRDWNLAKVWLRRELAN